MEKKTEVAKVNIDISPSERFTNAVIKEYSSNVGELEMTSFQKKLTQNYFIKLDSVLITAEQKRLGSKNPDITPCTWANVNMSKLSQDVMSFTSIGLDPMQQNHINLILFKNNKTNKYDVGFIIGYRGIEIKSKKYGFEVPDDVIVELVYSTDIFKSRKKDINNRIENYSFEIKNDFDRGNVIGGFYYHLFINKPEKNKLVTMSLKDILKRKPKYASAEFWGGEKSVYNNGKKSGTETIEGYYDEMLFKTIYRKAYNDITIDSEKIDDHLLTVINSENSEKQNSVEQTVNDEVEENANNETLSFDDAEEVKEEIATEEPKESAMQPSIDF